MTLYLRHTLALSLPLLLTAAAFGQAATPAPTAPAPATPAAAPVAATPAFKPPYPERTNPFKQPDNKAALATRREAAAHQIDVRLKGFIQVGGETRAVVAIDGEVLSLGKNERRGDLQVLEIASPTLTLQRGRYRWTESLIDTLASKSEASQP